MTQLKLTGLEKLRFLIKYCYRFYLAKKTDKSIELVHNITTIAWIVCLAVTQINVSYKEKKASQLAGFTTNILQLSQKYFVY